MTILEVSLLVSICRDYWKSIMYICVSVPDHPALPTDPLGEMHLQPTPLFHLPSDNVSMQAAIGTPLGRIFLAGEDSCLYNIIWGGLPGGECPSDYKAYHCSIYENMYVYSCYLSTQMVDITIHFVTSVACFFSCVTRLSLYNYNYSSHTLHLFVIVERTFYTLV